MSAVNENFVKKFFFKVTALSERNKSLFINPNEINKSIPFCL